MAGKYIIETKDEVIYGLLDFSERKNGSKSPKKDHHIITTERPCT